MNADLWKPAAKKIISVMLDVRLDGVDLNQIALIINEQGSWQLSNNVIVLGNLVERNWNAYS